MEITIGSIFEAPEKYICHQCNCMTNRAAHLAASVFNRFPWANIYAQRHQPDKPGTILVRGNGRDQRFVIAMLAQVYPGKSKFPDSTKDGLAARKMYFASCLDEILKIQDLTSIAFPFGIGCGAAGGDWREYLKKIEEFAEETTARVVIYRLPD